MHNVCTINSAALIFCMPLKLSCFIKNEKTSVKQKCQIKSKIGEAKKMLTLTTKALKAFVCLIAKK